MQIAVDAMGGDHAPAQVLQGASQAAAEYGIEVCVVGLPSAVQPLLDQHPLLRLVPCTQVIAMDDHPAQAVRSKPDSSMNVCARMCKDGKADAWVSAGNSGAIMATALFVQGRIRGVDRPALGSIVPTQTGFAYFLDVGANVDSKPEYMVQFATMGAVYARQMLGRPNPRVGLLSNGEEEGQGDELVKETTRRTIGGMLIRREVRRLRARIDWREFGGAPLLGIDGVAVIAHGRSDARAIKNAIRVTRDAVENHLVGKIRAEVGK